ncbi:hypothetical protein ACP70R_038434 [Stipagrostis hirtigluma subsp. patula]
MTALIAGEFVILSGRRRARRSPSPAAGELVVHSDRRL